MTQYIHVEEPFLDQLEMRLAQARKQVDKLTPAFLARAFAGKLVPQDPNDEPADKLLERIQTRTQTKKRICTKIQTLTGF